MDLISAIKSGRKFKRTGFDWIDNNHDRILSLTLEEITAHDWEIEPEVYEFECSITTESRFSPKFKREIKSLRDKIPLNKKCRVRVEVIDEPM